MKLKSGGAYLFLVSALLLALSPARAAERSVDAVSIVPNVAPQTPAAPQLPGASLNAGVALPSVPNAQTLAAPLSAGTVGSPSAASASGPVFGSAAPRQAPVFGKKGLPAAAPQDAPAMPASAVAAAAAPRGPPAGAAQAGSDHPLIERARAEARKLGTSAETDGGGAAAPEASEGDVAIQQQLLRTRGWGILPAGSVVTKARAARIAAEVDKDWQRGGIFNTWDLYDEHKGWVKDVGGDAQGRGGTREMLEDLTRRVQEALPGEDVEIRDAQLRLRYQKMDRDFLHVDGGGYVTATIALKGPGTQVYEFNGGVKEHVAPLDSVALITNVDRERATNVDGTLHSSPSPDKYDRARDHDERWVLIVRYKRAGQAKATEAERARFESRQKAKQKLAQAWRDRSNPKPKEKGFSLFGIKLGGGGE